jgi:uncharacterized protein (DUF1800 family)
MAMMLDLRAAAIAANRFGFGAKPGELTDIAPDPRGWLKQQLAGPDPRPIGTPSAAQLAAYLQAVREKKADVDLAKMFQKNLREDFKAAAIQRTMDAAASAVPFHERLVQFWSNHFTVSIQRPIVIPVALGFENEAIRPYVLGKFRDMLSAVAAHPAMLLYLDNAQSVGPNSIGGRLRDKGLNENLAREMLELHTVGVDGGYSQTDVTEFAKILTGWSINRDNDNNPGTFRWRPIIHEPGKKTLLGRTYREDGVDEGIAALSDLAGRPETARHIATKLVRHFVADDPPQDAVDKIAAVFRSSDGDLRAVSLALIDLPQIWAEPLTKIKTPNDLITSAYRTFGLADGKMGDTKFGDGAIAGLKLMGQVPFDAPSPAGWPDTADSWISPEAMMTRIQWALAAGQKLEGHADAREIARGSIQPVAADSTMFHIDNAPSPAEGLALLIASPEFQRR